MFKTAILKIWVGFMYLEYHTTSVEEATNFRQWMEDRGHTVEHEEGSAEKLIPNIERI